MNIKFLAEISGIVVIPGVDTSCWLWIEGVYEPFQYAEVEDGVPTECDTPETFANLKNKDLRRALSSDF